MDLLEIENAHIPVLLFSAAALRSQTKRRTLVTNTILLYLILYYMLYHTTDIRWVDISVFEQGTENAIGYKNQPGSMPPRFTAQSGILGSPPEAYSSP